MKKIDAKFLCRTAGIAALYIILTYLAAAFGLASGVIQIRFSEMLCVLPMFTPAAIPGLALGCLTANFLTGSVLTDCIFGTLATLIGAFGTYYLRKYKLFAFLPPIISNMIIVPPVLKAAYGVADAYWFLVVTVGIGEIISVGIFGFFLYSALKKKNIFN